MRKDRFCWTDESVPYLIVIPPEESKQLPKSEKPKKVKRAKPKL